MTRSRSLGSLRRRLLTATVVTLALALTGAHLWLSGLFRDHVMRQFDSELAHQLDQLTARLDIDARGQPMLNPRGLSDPRWDKPYSGLYWQIDRLDTDGQGRSGVLRSRSLWDTQLSLETDALADGSLHTHDSTGPQGQTLRVIERSIQLENSPQRWRLMVAADLQEARAATDRFQGVLTTSLAVLGMLLILAALAQVAVGLAPLKTLQEALSRLRDGQTDRLQGRFPTEVQTLIEDFNTVLAHNAEVVGRARTLAGNLAHALKTPLAVLDNAAREAPSAASQALVAEQVQVAQRQIQWHLAHARAAASAHLPGQRTPLAPALDGLLRVMNKVHAHRHLDLSMTPVPADWAFAGESQDLQEMLGNLLDNACRNATSIVRIHTQHHGACLQVVIDDDGPGIAAKQRESVLQRGVRLDESSPGSGLGLAIVVDLAALYGGSLTLADSPDGGLSARLELPAASSDGRAMS